MTQWSNRAIEKNEEGDETDTYPDDNRARGERIDIENKVRKTTPKSTQ